MSTLRNKLSARTSTSGEGGAESASADYSYNYTNRKRMDAQTVIEYSKKPGEILYESEAGRAPISKASNTRRATSRPTPT